METNTKTRTTPSRDVDAELGRRVHMLMWDRKLSGAAFGKALGIDSSSLAKKLRGERGWALSEVVSVASALGVSVSYLFGEEHGGDENDPRQESDGGRSVGPTGIEPMTSTVKDGQSNRRLRIVEAPAADLRPVAPVVELAAWRAKVA